MPEADAGLDPETPGSCPGPKAGAKLLSYPGVPINKILKKKKKKEICVTCLLYYFMSFPLPESLFYSKT